MKTRILTFILVIAAGTMYAQDLTFVKPDYTDIEKHISDTSSIYYYPKLLERAKVFDTTLTREDYRHLYYGFAFMDTYQPYSLGSDDKLMKYYRNENLKVGEIKEFIRLATEAIEENPVDIRPMNSMAYMYHLLGDEEMAKKVAYRFNGTIDAIMSTGDGESCETAFHVLFISHEYVILNMFQFNMVSQALINEKGESCDYLKLIEDERQVEGIYFNVTKMFSKAM